MSDREKFLKSKTYKNLQHAFAGESMAKNHYVFWAKRAKSEGFPLIASIFLETALNEEEHAKTLYKYMLGDGKKKGKIPTTKINLEEAAKGEKYENESMYPEFAKVAKEEGYEEIANTLLNIAKAELAHKTRFESLLKKVSEDTMFKSKNMTLWRCSVCGYIEFGTEPPAECPSCGHDRSYFFQVGVDEELVASLKE